jgi:hypothetical protein
MELQMGNAFLNDGALYYVLQIASFGGEYADLKSHSIGKDSIAHVDGRTQLDLATYALRLFQFATLFKPCNDPDYPDYGDAGVAPHVKCCSLVGDHWQSESYVRTDWLRMAMGRAIERAFPDIQNPSKTAEDAIRFSTDNGYLLYYGDLCISPVPDPSIANTADRVLYLAGIPEDPKEAKLRNEMIENAIRDGRLILSEYDVYGMMGLGLKLLKTKLTNDTKKGLPTSETPFETNHENHPAPNWTTNYKELSLQKIADAFGMSKGWAQGIRESEETVGGCRKIIVDDNRAWVLKAWLATALPQKPVTNS